MKALFPPTAFLSIQLGRIDFDAPSVETFDVEGVATVQIEGESVPVYYLDCIRSNATREGLNWTRETGQLSPMFMIDNSVMHALRLQTTNVQHSDLGVYVCTDTNTGDFVKLNVTSSECEDISTDSVSVDYFHIVTDSSYCRSWSTAQASFIVAF